MYEALKQALRDLGEGIQATKRLVRGSDAYVIASLFDGEPYLAGHLMSVTHTVRVKRTALGLAAPADLEMVHCSRGGALGRRLPRRLSCSAALGRHAAAPSERFG